MKALKISLVSIFAILFITAISIISVYAADNHNQIKSWVNNEVQETQPKDPELDAAEKLVEQLRQRLEERNTKITELENNVQEIKNEVTTANETISQLQQDNSAKEIKIQTLQTEIEQNNQKIEEFKQNAEQNAEEIARLTKENEEKQTNITNLQGIIANNEQFIEGLQTLITQKTEKITELEAAIEEKNSQLQELQSTIEDLQQGTATKSSLDKYCERTNEMIVYKVAFFDPELDDGYTSEVTIGNFNYNNEPVQNEIDKFIKEPINCPERYVFKGWAFEENGDVIETLPFQNKAICIYAVYEDAQPIQVNIHIGSTTLEKTIYANHNYRRGLFIPKWLQNSHLYQKNFIGFATSPDCTNEEEVVHIIENAGGDYYLVFYNYVNGFSIINSSSMYYVEQIVRDQTFSCMFIDEFEELNQIVALYFQTHKDSIDGELTGWSTTENGDSIEVLEETLKQYSKFYALYN